MDDTEAILVSLRARGLRPNAAIVRREGTGYSPTSEGR